MRLGWFSNSWFLDVFWGRKGGDKEGWLLGRGGDNGVVMREGGGCWGNGGGGGCGRAREYVYKKRKYYKNRSLQLLQRFQCPSTQSYPILTISPPLSLTTINLTSLPSPFPPFPPFPPFLTPLPSPPSHPSPLTRPPHPTPLLPRSKHKNPTLTIRCETSKKL